MVMLLSVVCRAQAPRDKLVCILNCCRMLNSMLASRSKAEGVGEKNNNTQRSGLSWQQ